MKIIFHEEYEKCFNMNEKPQIGIGDVEEHGAFD